MLLRGRIGWQSNLLLRNLIKLILVYLVVLFVFEVRLNVLGFSVHLGIIEFEHLICVLAVEFLHEVFWAWTLVAHPLGKIWVLLAHDQVHGCHVADELVFLILHKVIFASFLLLSLGPYLSLAFAIIGLL